MAEEKFVREKFIAAEKRSAKLTYLTARSVLVDSRHWPPTRRYKRLAQTRGPTRGGQEGQEGGWWEGGGGWFLRKQKLVYTKQKNKTDMLCIPERPKSWRI